MTSDRKKEDKHAKEAKKNFRKVAAALSISLPFSRKTIYILWYLR
jgi:hypothetical protein